MPGLPLRPRLIAMRAHSMGHGTRNSGLYATCDSYDMYDLYDIYDPYDLCVLYVRYDLYGYMAHMIYMSMFTQLYLYVPLSLEIHTYIYIHTVFGRYL